MYQDVFFSTKYGTFDQEEANVINVLVEDQVKLMADALKLWPNVCPQSFQPLLEHLQKQYEGLKAK